MRRILAWVLWCACVALASNASAQTGGDDIVVLRGGGRLRGTVLEEDPATGVRIQLADGRVRRVAAREVEAVRYGGGATPAQAPPVAPAPAPSAPEAGALKVSTTEPATVYVDGASVGDAPQTLTGVAPGVHEVRVVFAEGGSREERVHVEAGVARDVSVDAPESLQRFRARRGVHAGVEASPTYFVAFGRQGALGARVAGLGNVGLSEVVDLRFGLYAEAVAGGLFPVAAFSSFRLNLGAVYSIDLGLEAGSRFGDTPDPFRDGLGFGAGGTFVGPRWSFFSFRFGASRQFELDLEQALTLATETGHACFENTIGLRYLFLSAPLPAPRQEAKR